MMPRFQLTYNSAITSLAWRPHPSVRTSRSPFDMPRSRVKCEDLLVGDEKGRVWYYSVEWPDAWEVQRNGWSGGFMCLAQIKAHEQQICGLAWAPDGNMFASGGNDDCCCLFDIKSVIGADDESILHDARQQAERSRGDPFYSRSLNKMFGDIKPSWMSRKVPPPLKLGLIPPLVTIRDKGKTKINPTRMRELRGTIARHRWNHGAAVKAIAFCPWRSGLVATGGGSQDKAIHFYHTTTGASLAMIPVCAQVTGLVWSTTKREIAACFGYTQPEHPVRIAVFNWPQCNQVMAIPWPGEMRSLYTIGWPVPVSESPEKMSRCKKRRYKEKMNSTKKEHWRYDEKTSAGCSEIGARSPGRRRTVKEETYPEQIYEGCIVLAASDETVKFHKLWGPSDKVVANGPGMLGGSDILESMEGIDKEGETIR